MLYPSAQAWRDAPSKHACLFAMSGLGKTHVSNMLRETGTWFHYSVDYRIGTRYMGEHIADNFKAEAMKNPFLAELLRTDSIYVASNITFDNLAPLSTYLGKPGDPSKGGLPIQEYRRRQAQHDAAERATLLDTVHFIERAKRLYDYPNFVCDTGGSICEVVDPKDPNDPILKALSENTLMIWIEGTDAHRDELIRRFDRAPKPMCYQPAFLERAWNDYLTETSNAPDRVDPDAFVRWTYTRALAHRQPIYAAMANWGVTVAASEIAEVRTEADFVDVIAQAIERRTKSA
ncbi:ATPase [Shimia ponticola]|uniref:ATPase n=1 Tax=Shimia ponticola TaxID=2582893 RepID=UPI0011BE92C8|nr:ATPase [Shimia ponticola]